MDYNLGRLGHHLWRRDILTLGGPTWTACRLRIVACYSVLGVLLGIPVARITAQPARDSIPALVIALDSFPYYGEDAVIIRRANREPQFVVAFRKAAITAALLQQAFRSVRIIQATSPAATEPMEILRVRGAFAEKPASGRARRFANEIANALGMASEETVEGVGTGSIVRVLLPAIPRRPHDSGGKPRRA